MYLDKDGRGRMEIFYAPPCVLSVETNELNQSLRIPLLPVN